MADELSVPDVPGDGIVDVPVDSTGEKKMAASAQFENIMEQSWSDHFGATRQASLDMQAGHRFVTETTRLGFVGQRELYAAKAAGNLEKDALADSILQQRSARDQPGKATG